MNGELAQMVERPFSMREVPGSMPGFSTCCTLISASRYCLSKDHILQIGSSLLLRRTKGWRCGSAG